MHASRVSSCAKVSASARCARKEHLPEPAASYVRMTNESDPAGFIALFAEEAVIDDPGRITQGRKSIQEWAANDIFAAHVTLDVLDANGDEDDATLRVKVDGDFDRTGLPNPLIMTFHVIALEGKITKLTCQLAGR